MIDIAKPIIESLLDTDLYKFTIGAVVFHFFPDAEVTYEFFNRGKTEFPLFFKEHLEKQIDHLCSLSFHDWELEYLTKKTPYLRRTYIEFLRGFHMDAREVLISQNEGKLKVFIKGPWYRTIFWEVFLMSIISELYFRMTGIEPDLDWEHRIIEKTITLDDNKCLWSDFGTRRRFSKTVQSAVVSRMATAQGFLGTSNVYLAKKLDVAPIGTTAHEAVMAMSAKVGYTNANRTWLEYWTNYYNGELGIALPDTFTTKVFLRQFDTKWIRIMDGLRQDSGDPFRWMNEDVIPYYKKMGISTRDKKIIFSDSLDVAKCVELNKVYGEMFKVIFGIGTHLTNDVFTEKQKAAGIKPLNMVIKMTGANFGHGFKPTIKLSDDFGKYTGDLTEIQRAKLELNIL